jgi:UDP-N-acetylglucosamine 2-epimerase
MVVGDRNDAFAEAILAFLQHTNLPHEVSHDR